MFWHCHMEGDFMKKLLILLFLTIFLLTACNNKKENIANAEEDISLEEFQELVNTVNNLSDSGIISELAKTAMSLLAFGREFTYNTISDDTIQIIAVKTDDLQKEFDCYYKYEGQGIDIVWEFGFENLYIKTIDEEGNALFEFHFYPEGRTYLINPNYQNQITVNQEI